PWNLGHEVYTTGRISSATARQALETLHALRKEGIPLKSVIAIATGALRDAENRKKFLALLENKLDLHVRVVSGREEATLLSQGYLRKIGTLPALIADIGGGSLELIYLSEDQSILRDTLPLGAIRVHHFGQDLSGNFVREDVENWIQESFLESTVLFADEIFCTGGTAKALSKCLGPSITFDELVAFEDEVARKGPPKSLKQDRGEVLLAGVIVLRMLMEHTKATRLTYLKLPIGRIFMEKYARRDSGGTPRRKLLPNVNSISTMSSLTSSDGQPSPTTRDEDLPTEPES
ncbi:MAG: hypothetical protein AAF517_00005, partial [Planctomycetota bacterium]